MRKIIHNAIIVNEGSRFNGYLLVDNDVITAIEHGDAPQNFYRHATSQKMPRAHIYYPELSMIKCTSAIPD